MKKRTSFTFLAWVQVYFPKEVPVSAEHRKNGSQMSEEYEGGFINSLVIITLKKKKEGYLLTMNTWKQLLNKTHVKISEKCLRHFVSVVQRCQISWSKLIRWKNSINGFCLSWKSKKLWVLKCFRCSFFETPMIDFLIEWWRATKIDILW